MEEGEWRRGSGRGGGEVLIVGESIQMTRQCSCGTVGEGCSGAH